VSRLFLVRHGQASFLEADYDKISPLGRRQSQLLGEYWAQRNFRFDRVFTGSRNRQKDTATVVADAYRRAGQPFPSPVVMPEFDEYDGENVLRGAVPELLQSSEECQALHSAFTGSRSGPDRVKNFERLFEFVTTKWVNGEIVLPGVEPWTEFCARVNHGISSLIAKCGHGVTAVVFASGGPIGVAIARSLHLSTSDTLRVMWMSRNASYSEFLFSGERFTLSAFNAHPHLDDPALLTYR
jgi:broad specificity phosphatase PhoE